jgi:electron-transferring-flavoprotein dehydrogenase
MLPAEVAFEAVAAGRARDKPVAFPEAFRKSWQYEELHKMRNFKPYMKQRRLWLGSFLFGADHKVFRGKVPWTPHNSADHTALKPAAHCAKIDYPKAGGVLSFDRLSLVFLSNTNHEEDQPCHLRPKNPSVSMVTRSDAPMITWRDGRQRCAAR